LFLDERGEVCTRLVPEVISACREDATGGKGATVFTPAQGDPVTAGKTTLTLAAKTGAAALALWKEAPADLFLTADVTLTRGATLNLLLRGKEQKVHPGRVGPSPLDDSYVLSLDASAQQVTLTRQNAWNRTPAMRVQPIELPTDRPVKLHVILHGDVLEAFMDDRISLSARVQLPAGGLALLARDGTVRLNNLRIAHLPDGK